MNTKNYENSKNFLNYDKDSGIFKWKVDLGRKIKKGKNAGYLRKEGYIAIGFNGKVFYAHRLAWYFIHNEIADYIDHANGNRSDNRIENLRSCTQSQNCMNRKVHVNNRTGYKGVMCQTGRKGFRARIMVRGKNINIGSFETAEEARDAYNEYAKKIQGDYYNG